MTQVFPEMHLERHRVLTVVLIDDTPDIRLLLRYALELHGNFEVLGEADDGAAGVKMVRRIKPDLVLLDLAMPVMDGIEALPLIRAHVPASRVIILSGFAKERMAERAVAGGADGYVQKGTSARQIVADIADVMGVSLTRLPDPRPVVTLVPDPPERDIDAELDEVNAALAAAAHELRGPATVMRAMAELLSKERATLGEQTAGRMLDAIIRQAQVLDRVTEDLLVSTQAERSALNVEVEPVHLLDVLQSAVVAMGTLNPVGVACADDIWVCADPARTLQIVSNLVSNAFKYGEAPVEIIATRKAAHILVQVIDNGRGVPEPFRAELFEQYTRVRGNQVRGSGIGLYVVKSLVEAQGGQVWHEPRQRGGSAFCFTLPISVPAVAVRPASRLPAGLEH